METIGVRNLITQIFCELADFLVLPGYKYETDVVLVISP